MKGPFEALGKWQNYAHYVLLTLAIFLFIHPYSEFLEQQIVAGLPYAWAKLFMWYTFWIFIADTIIHWIFYKLPEPWRWRD